MSVCLRGIEGRQRGHDLVDFGKVVRAREVVAHLGIEHPDRRRVALEQDQVREAHAAMTLAYSNFVWHARRAVAHGLAAIEEDVRDVVGFLLVLLDVIAVAAAEHLPVEVPRVVAGDILAVLGELDGKPAKGRLVRAGHVAFDDRARLDAEDIRRSGWL